VAAVAPSGLRRARTAAVQRATLTGYVAGWRLVRFLPEAAAHAAFRRIADGMFSRQGKAVRRLRGNLARVRPDLDPHELDGLTRDGVRSYLRYWCESFRLPDWALDDVVARTRTVDEHHLRGPQAAGRGVVAALPHMANWDWAGAWACGTGMPLTTVAERLQPERLYDEFVAYRAGLGMEILPLTGEQSAFPTLVERVRAGRLVCLLADRDLSRTSIEVDFCGVPARMPRGPALLARETGAPLVPTTLAYRGDDLEITFHPPVEHRPGPGGLTAMMQEVADAFGGAIRRDPQDWHMMQRVFAEDLS
jgi:phosphatidylinositol dimannoside acyltransferase